MKLKKEAKKEKQFREEKVVELENEITNNIHKTSFERLKKKKG